MGNGINRKEANRMRTELVKVALEELEQDSGQALSCDMLLTRMGVAFPETIMPLALHVISEVRELVEEMLSAAMIPLTEWYFDETERIAADGTAEATGGEEQKKRFAKRCVCGCGGPGGPEVGFKRAGKDTYTAAYYEHREKSVDGAIESYTRTSTMAAKQLGIEPAKQIEHLSATLIERKPQ